MVYCANAKIFSERSLVLYIHNVPSPGAWCRRVLPPQRSIREVLFTTMILMSNRCQMSPGGRSHAWGRQMLRRWYRMQLLAVVTVLISDVSPDHIWASERATTCRSMLHRVCCILMPLCRNLLTVCEACLLNRCRMENATCHGAVFCEDREIWDDGSKWTDKRWWNQMNRYKMMEAKTDIRR